MNTRKQKNLESFIFKTIDKEIEGTDIYNHNGSMWIIFTDEKKWVVEYTKDQTLWYNYTLFNNIMMLFGMENKETAEYVKTWFENRFLFKPKIVDDSIKERLFFVEDTIDNGVKHTERKIQIDYEVEYTIQNGVKHTLEVQMERLPQVEDTIQMGVKRVYTSGESKLDVEDTIQNGVKEIKSKMGESVKQRDHLVTNLGITKSIDDAIENGVKGVRGWGFNMRQINVEDTIQNGVKDSRGVKNWGSFGNIRVIDVLKNGVKHSEDGDWLDGDERIENIIKDGVKS